MGLVDPTSMRRSGSIREGALVEVDPLDDDVELLGRILREVVGLHEGPQIAVLVDRVRSLSGSGSPSDDDALAHLIADVDLASMTVLVRVLTLDFHLRTIAEQAHRADELATRARTSRGSLRHTVADVIAEGVSEADAAALLARMEVRPVFTAHPTEADHVDRDARPGMLLGHRTMRPSPVPKTSALPLRERAGLAPLPESSSVERSSSPASAI